MVSVLRAEACILDSLSFHAEMVLTPELCSVVVMLNEKIHRCRLTLILDLICISW
jgi:hypothetical protein